MQALILSELLYIKESKKRATLPVDKLSTDIVMISGFSFSWRGRDECASELSTGKRRVIHRFAMISGFSLFWRSRDECASELSTGYPQVIHRLE